MLFVAGMNMKFVLSMLAAGVGLFAVLVIAEPYRLKRFTAFLIHSKIHLGVDIKLSKVFMP